MSFLLIIAGGSSLTVAMDLIFMFVICLFSTFFISYNNEIGQKPITAVEVSYFCMVVCLNNFREII